MDALYHTDALLCGWFGVVGSGVDCIFEVKLRRARLVLGSVRHLWPANRPGIYMDHSDPFSLAIPP